MDMTRLLREEQSTSLTATKTNKTESQMAIYLSVIHALSHLAMSDMSEWIVNDIPSAFLVHPHMKNSLVDMWVSVHASSLTAARGFYARAKLASSSERKKSSTPFANQTRSDTPQ